MSDTAQSMVSRPQWAGGPAKSSPVRRRGENLLPVQPVKQRQPLHQQVFIPSERVPAQGRGPAGKPALPFSRLILRHTITRLSFSSRTRKAAEGLAPFGGFSDDRRIKNDLSSISSGWSARSRRQRRGSCGDQRQRGPCLRCGPWRWERRGRSSCCPCTPGTGRSQRPSFRRHRP